MDRNRICVFVLLLLLNPVSCTEFSLNDPIICYILDGVLIIYCIVATALFFREKLSHQVPTFMTPEPTGGIYQELERPRDADPYEVLEPSKKKREKKKKKSEPAQANREAGSEPVPGTSASAPPLVI